METATKVVTALGGIITAIGLGWLLTGAYTFFSGWKNKNPVDQDNGMSGIISGAALGVLAAGITAAIVAGLNAISF
ncbi:hypothetical protein [Streptococcus sobrinus]|uniref:hypothetical protein n=1 Tax=Streptococcus sobrinus TaxID=1310 RepID=UPI0002FBBA53|nr:hypothetical protein [Streptococcus sobrinus]